MQAYVIQSGQTPIGYIQLYNAYDFPRDVPLEVLPGSLAALDFYIGEESFVGKGLGAVAILWEVLVIPENEKALRFWRRAISRFTDGHYTEEIIKVDFDPDQPNRIVFKFDSYKDKTT